MPFSWRKKHKNKLYFWTFVGKCTTYKWRGDWHCVISSSDSRTELVYNIIHYHIRSTKALKETSMLVIECFYHKNNFRSLDFVSYQRVTSLSFLLLSQSCKFAEPCSHTEKFTMAFSDKLQASFGSQPDFAVLGDKIVCRKEK